MFHSYAHESTILYFGFSYYSFAILSEPNLETQVERYNIHAVYKVFSSSLEIVSIMIFTSNFRNTSTVKVLRYIGSNDAFIPVYFSSFFRLFSS